MKLMWEYEYTAVIPETQFAGIETANAIAEVLFGFYNPSDKLITTFSDHIGHISLYYDHNIVTRL